MIKFFKKKYGYPECDFLNNAIRFLLSNSDYGKNKTAIEEICYALVAMNGYVYDDLKVQLKEKGIFNFN